MYQVEDEPMETIHLYVVREGEKRPNTAFPLFCAFLCLACIAASTLYSAQHPYYEHKRITVPAIFLPLKVFTASAPIIPTGIKTYPATTAHGVLTITNGSIIGQSIPAGFTVQGVATDSAVYVPPGNANGYGYATVPAHALMSGTSGNLPPRTINQVIGSSVYIRNLTAFLGGRDSYSVKYVTEQDKQNVLLQARNLLLVQISANMNALHYPCKEAYLYERVHMTINWRCQFITYHIPSYMHVSSVRLEGKNLVVVVFFTPLRRLGWVK